MQDEAALLFVSGEGSTEWNFVQSHVSLGAGLKELQDEATLLLFVSGVCGEGSTKWDFSKSHLRLLTGLKGLQDEATLLFVSGVCREGSTKWGCIV